MVMSLYMYCWLAREKRGRTFRQSYATWKRFHLYRVGEGFTHPDLYKGNTP